MYVSGSPEYEPDNADWACWQEETYLPEERYAPSQALLEICKILTDSASESAQEIGRYAFCLGYAAITVTHLMQTIDTKILLGEVPSRRVSVGFDDGDYINLGEITPAGWVATA